jgi:hypothetical protein
MHVGKPFSFTFTQIFFETHEPKPTDGFGRLEHRGYSKF